VSRVFITGGTGLIGTALLTRLLDRGDEVLALARSDAASTALEARGARVVRGEAYDEDVLARGIEGCELAFNVAGVNSLCVVDPRPMELLNASGPVAAVRAAARAGVNRLVHTSTAATIGEPPGTIGNEQTPHRGWHLSTYERTKTAGERAALAAAREAGQDLVCINPSSVQGPGRAAAPHASCSLSSTAA
jgi:dihydroflavonol-4-reductase